MKNFSQTGDAVTVPAPADVKSGDLVVVGTLFGVAATDAESGDDVVIHTSGVYTLPKKSAQAWSAIGTAIYWDSEYGEATTAADDGGTPTPTAFVQIGHAVATAANPSATGKVRLSI